MRHAIHLPVRVVDFVAYCHQSMGLNSVKMTAFFKNFAPYTFSYILYKHFGYA